ncbi:hypothetical protein NK6_7155 [Bradyrhizobium diazoefficiens]|uniref:Uncharacterized protein n=1 Tax=Bradyrhizobium diazoefficiens TaxID=1355477 RepID=A0A0E4G0H0_9BRAD|nr:hypothetical protein NK6_7155 [Bradyrhizobium diazoefficiens]
MRIPAEKFAVTAMCASRSRHRRNGPYGRIMTRFAMPPG